MALKRREPAAGLLHHSDQGSLVAASQDYQRIIDGASDDRQHLSRRGNCYDNAVRWRVGSPRFQARARANTSTVAATPSMALVSDYM